MNKEISILNLELLTKVAILALFISFIVGIIPALYLSKFKAVEVLKGNISRSKQGYFSKEHYVRFSIFNFRFFSYRIFNNL